MSGRPMSDETLSDRAVSWAWDQVRERCYPAAVGIVLVYLAGKSRRLEGSGEWLTAASHGELADISGARATTVRQVLGRLRADGLVRTAPRVLSPSRRERGIFIAVPRDDEGAGS